MLEMSSRPNLPVALGLAPVDCSVLQYKESRSLYKLTARHWAQVYAGGGPLLCSVCVCGVCGVCVWCVWCVCVCGVWCVMCVVCVVWCVCSCNRLAPNPHLPMLCDPQLPGPVTTRLNYKRKL